MASLSLHGKVIGGTLVFLLLLAIGSRWSQGTGSEGDNPTIAFEHGTPATLSLTLSKRGTVRVVDIDHDAQETVFVSVPKDWRRTEVRGVALTSVTSQPPELGFVRFTLPPHAGITFRAEGNWEHIVIENPRGVPMTLKFTNVDGDNNTSVRDVRLIQRETISMP